MEKKNVVQKKGTKKRRKPKLRFRFGTLVVIFILAFAACFVIYMIAANVNDDFFVDEFDKTIAELENEKEQNALSPTEAMDPGGSEGDAVPDEGTNSAPVVNPVPESAAENDSYFENCCLVTDNTLAGMKNYGKFAESNVFTNSQLSAVTCNSAKVESSFGYLTSYEIIKDKKPSVLYIMLGSDLGTSDSDEMIANYTTFVNNLHTALPSMKIYVMQLPPVIYDSDTVSNEKVNTFNTQLLAMCNTLGVYCIDTNTALKSEEGKLVEDYWSYETLSLSDAGLKAVSDYILTHIS